jgi:hypothetical protein
VSQITLTYGISKKNAKNSNPITKYFQFCFACIFSHKLPHNQIKAELFVITDSTDFFLLPNFTFTYVIEKNPVFFFLSFLAILK